ncbi:MAG: OmpH family outer membrane protein [Deltaproteobacteria bacterium]
MKKLLITLTLAAGLCSAFVWLPDACGQNGAPPSRAVRPAGASRIALIDLGEVLRKYRKYEDVSQEAKAAREAAGVRYRQKVEHVQELGKELQEAKLERESPQYAEKEKKFYQLSAGIDTFRAVTEKELKQSEARILLAIYQEVTGAVQEIAEQNGYTLVLRFDREAVAARSYSTISQTVSQPVVRHDSRDDISDAVIAWLNKQYDAAGGAASLPSAAGSAAAGASSASGPGTAPRDVPAPGGRKLPSR